MSVIWLHFVPSFLAITRNLTRFLKDDVKQMKDTRGYFNKISSDLDSSLNKNSAVSKSKPNEIEECTNLLQATQSCFRYTALDYVYQVRNQILIHTKLVTTYEVFDCEPPALQSYNQQRGLITFALFFGFFFCLP